MGPADCSPPCWKKNFCPKKGLYFSSSQIKVACILPPRQQQPILCISCWLAQDMCRLWSSPGITAQVGTTSEPESWRQEAL